MAETHHVEVLEKKGNIIKIRMYILIPEITQFCVSNNCALQIIWDKAHPAFGKNTPISEAISAENRLDFRWLRDNADRFIESVKLLETFNYPAPPSLNFGEHRYDLSALPQATIEIRVSDKRWISHVRRGSSWDSVPVDAVEQ
jgi:hypothetical protein